METGKKRDRSVNFTREETEALLSLVEERKEIIENKKSDAVTWQDKEYAWKAIAEEFNSSSTSGIFRDAKHLKLKYEALKRDVRKKISADRAERYDNGGVSFMLPLSPLERRVKELILLTVDGSESVYDSEQINNTSTEYITVQPDYTNIIDSHEIEPDTKKKKIDLAVPSTSQEVEFKVFETPSKKWDETKSASPKSKKNTGSTTKEKKRPFDKLAEEKINVVALQKLLLEEERKQKMLQRQILHLELEHKRQIYELEKEQMLIKLEILKVELEKAKQN